MKEKTKDSDDMMHDLLVPLCDLIIDLYLLKTKKKTHLENEELKVKSVYCKNQR